MEEVQTTLDVKEKIVESARELFIQNGFNGVSVREIAAASGTNVAMVNYYFGSKYNLFANIFNEAFTIVTGKIFVLLESDLPFFDMLKEWIYAYYDVLSEYPGLPLFIMNEVAQHPETLKNHLDFTKPNDIFYKMECRFQEEIERGAIPPTNILDFMLNLLSLCLFPFIFMPVVKSFLNVEHEEYGEFLKSHKEYVADFVINAIKNGNEQTI